MTCFESWQLASCRTWQARTYTSIANKNGLVTVLGGIVLWSNHQITALPGTPIPSLYNVNKLMLVLQGPIDLIVVSCPKINHDALVSEEEHHLLVNTKVLAIVFLYLNRLQLEVVHPQDPRTSSTCQQYAKTPIASQTLQL